MMGGSTQKSKGLQVKPTHDHALSRRGRTANKHTPMKNTKTTKIAAKATKPSKGKAKTALWLHDGQTGAKQYLGTVNGRPTTPRQAYEKIVEAFPCDSRLASDGGEIRADRPTFDEILDFNGKNHRDGRSNDRPSPKLRPEVKRLVEVRFNPLNTGTIIIDEIQHLKPTLLKSVEAGIRAHNKRLRIADK